MTMTTTIERRLFAYSAHAFPPFLLPSISGEALRAVCAAAAKDESKPRSASALVCDALERADGVAITEMAKAKCVHPDRPVAKLCKDCPRK